MFNFIRNKLLQTMVIGAASTTLLSGCTASINFTESPNTIARLAEDALEETVGFRPIINCDEELIDIVEDNTVICVLKDPMNNSKYDTKVVIANVSGSNYSVLVEVSDSPR